MIPKKIVPRSAKSREELRRRGWHKNAIDALLMIFALHACTLAQQPTSEEQQTPPNTVIGEGSSQQPEQSYPAIVGAFK